MFEAELKDYLHRTNAVLPGPQARKAFAAYTAGCVRDIAQNEPDADFAAVREQLPDPTQAAEEFLAAQPEQTRQQWQRQARRRKWAARIAIAAVIIVLAGIVAFYVKTKGVFVVNTVTYYTDYGDTDLTPEEMLRIAEEQARARHSEEEWQSEE